MISHYHHIWETLQVANQELRQWLKTNQEQPTDNNTTSNNYPSTTSGPKELYPRTQPSKNTSMVELEMELVKELEQSLSEIDSVDISCYPSKPNRNQPTRKNRNRSQHDYSLPSTHSRSHIEGPVIIDSIEMKDNDSIWLHHNIHRNVCKTIDCILDRDAKSLSKMKQSWQKLHQWSKHLHPYLEKKKQQRTVHHNSNDSKEYVDMNIKGDSFLSDHSLKEIYSDGRRETYYASSHIHKIAFPNNGYTFIFFPNGQLERHLSDGRVEVIYADGSIGLMSKDGIQEKLFLRNGKVVYRNRMANHTYEKENQ
ncbi:hypothetical protein Gasu2_56880 [Galdieria sulphuraria]|nr:hypothetical protein Gasu2_56880 [Galdieria sulphuraria]